MRLSYTHRGCGFNSGLGRFQLYSTRYSWPYFLPEITDVLLLISGSKLPALNAICITCLCCKCLAPPAGVETQFWHRSYPIISYPVVYMQTVYCDLQYNYCSTEYWKREWNTKDSDQKEWYFKNLPWKPASHPIYCSRTKVRAGGPDRNFI